MSERRAHIIRNAIPRWPQHQQWQQDTAARSDENAERMDTSSPDAKQATKKRGLVEQP
jgi:hypothetical protein